MSILYLKLSVCELYATIAIVTKMLIELMIVTIIRDCDYYEGMRLT